MPKKKKDDAIVDHVASDERSSQAESTGDVSLDEVLMEPGAGASDNEIDVESTIGEDKAVEKSSKDKAKNRAKKDKEEKVEETSALSSQEPDDQSGDAGSVEEEEIPHPTTPEATRDWNDKNKKKASKGKKEHVQGPKRPEHSKKYRNAVKDLDLAQSYSREDAIMLVKKTSYSKFDGTVEAHIKLSIQNQRGIISLPAGTGKEKKVLAISNTNIDDVLKQIESNKIDFDIAIATPDVMPKLAKVARVLGPKGLMPNPKSGTVTTDLDKAKAEFAGGRIEFKQDKGGAIHQAIGKVSFDDEKLLQNLNTLLGALPSGKITSISLSATMGPGIKVKLA